MLGIPMKRIFYVSRCARSLSGEDLRKIQQSSERNNPRVEITGFLIRVGDYFFQALEGPEESVDRLFQTKIREDSRHTEIRTLTMFNNGTGGGGHGIVAHKLEQDPVDENLFNVWVYDNSYPGNTNAVITVDTSGAEGDTVEAKWSLRDPDPIRPLSHRVPWWA